MRTTRGMLTTTAPTVLRESKEWYREEFQISEAILYFPPGRRISVPHVRLCEHLSLIYQLKKMTLFSLSWTKKKNEPINSGIGAF